LTLARKEVILVTGQQIIRDESVSRAPIVDANLHRKAVVGDIRTYDN